MENLSIDLAVDLGRTALFVVLQLSLPLLMVGLVVGLAVSLVQAVTQIQEQTLSFVPKILAVVGILFALLPWMILIIVNYTENLFGSLDQLFRPM
jgi:flagellar biosynthetic protein FliQ